MHEMDRRMYCPLLMYSRHQKSKRNIQLNSRESFNPAVLAIIVAVRFGHILTTDQHPQFNGRSNPVILAIRLVA